jgi:hypothetical protein
MAILMVGLVGIYALFPAGIHSTKESVQDSRAAIIAESFFDALKAAMRSAQSTPQGNLRIMPVHDGVPSNWYVILPRTTSVKTDHPNYSGGNPALGSSPPGSASDFGGYLFRMGTDQYIQDILNDERQPRHDPSDALDQYVLAFSVVKVSDAHSLYQFHIGVYRHYRDLSSEGLPPGSPWPRGRAHPDQIKEFRGVLSTSF